MDVTDRRSTRPCTVLVLAVLLAIGGCAGLQSPHSQLFADGTAPPIDILYRVEQEIPAREASGTLWRQMLGQGARARAAERRLTTLAVRYPHPAGKAGMARVECVVEAADPAQHTTARLPGWLERARQLADDGLPGVTLADGVHEAMGLDVPYAELADLPPQLQSSAVPGASAGSAVVQVACTVNDQPLHTGGARIAQLDRLVARVRKEGGVISHHSRMVAAMKGFAPPAATSSPPTLNPAALPVAYPATGAEVVTVGYQVPALRRLPPVDSSVGTGDN